MAEILEFQAQAIPKGNRASKRLAKMQRRRLALNALWLFYVQWHYGFSFEDLTGNSRLVFMSLLLYPSYRGVPNPYKSMNYDLITVNSRPAEQLAFREVSKYEAWAHRPRITLYSFHKTIMEAEREVMKRRGASSLKEVEYEGTDGETYIYSYTEIHFDWVYEEMQKLLGSWRIRGITRVEIVDALDLIESAYAQADALGYGVKFVVPFQASKKLAKTA